LKQIIPNTIMRATHVQLSQQSTRATPPAESSRRKSSIAENLLPDAPEVYPLVPPDSIWNSKPASATWSSGFETDVDSFDNASGRPSPPSENKKVNACEIWHSSCISSVA
jgi:hypothetical protein